MTTPSVRSALEPEYWSYIFSGIVGDGRHEASPFAAVVAQATSPLESLLYSWPLIQSTGNHLAARRLPWPQETLAPRADSAVERYLAMLDAMIGLPREYHAVAGYVLARCRPILKEHPDLAWETLAMCRSQGEDFTLGNREFHGIRREDGGELQHFEADFLAWLAPNNPTDDSRLHSWSALFHQISKIADPYLRFRAQWRLLGAIADEDDAVPIDLISILNQISEVSDQNRALELILMSIPATDLGLVDHIGLLDPLVRDLYRIQDPENRARAQCRLAYFASEQLETLLLGAVESVREIADPVRKAATIGEIRAAWGNTAGMSEALDAVAQTISEPWERYKALGRLSRLVHTFRNQYHSEELAWRLPPSATTTRRVFRHGHQAGPLPWVILYLSTMAAELEAGAATPAGAALWERLLGEERPDAVAAMVATGVIRIDQGHCHSSTNLGSGVVFP